MAPASTRSPSRSAPPRRCRRRDYALQLPGAPRDAQGRSRARGRERRRAQAGAPDAADRALPHACPARRRAPEHALQCLTGPGSELGDVLCSDPRVRKISFTGSTDGRRADHPRGGRQAALARAGVELPADRAPGCGSRAGRGRHAHGRLRQRGPGLHLGPAGPRGGRGLRRPRRRADPLVEGLRTGHPLDAGTTLGPVISQGEAERVERTIRAAVDGGATLLAGGGREGAVVAPTIVGDVDPRMALFPIRALRAGRRAHAVSGIDQAIQLANDSAYGLGAGLFTAASTPRSALPARSTPARSRSTPHHSGAPT